MSHLNISVYSRNPQPSNSKVQLEELIVFCLCNIAWLKSHKSGVSKPQPGNKSSVHFRAAVISSSIRGQKLFYITAVHHMDAEGMTTDSQRNDPVLTRWRSTFRKLSAFKEVESIKTRHGRWIRIVTKFRYINLKLLRLIPDIYIRGKNETQF